ncbi:MAG: hypothetical protein AABY86_07140, partial [Bdellovibrionota bacterium]
RGTEINVSFNERNKLTNVITYNGELKMAQKDLSTDVQTSTIRGLIDSDESVTIPEGRFSSANPSLGKRATIPVKLSPPQFFGMKSNQDFHTSSTLGSKRHKFRSMILPGVKSSSMFVNQSALKKTLTAQAFSETPSSKIDSVSMLQSSPDAMDDPPPEGFRDLATGRLAPPAGGLIDQNTGIYLAPPPGSAYDNITGVYVLPPEYGTFDPATGEYHPPEGYELNDSGEFLSSSATTRDAKLDRPTLASSASWGSATYADGTVGNDTDALEVENSDALSDEEALAISEDVLMDFNNQFYGDSIERRTMVKMGFEF